TTAQLASKIAENETLAANLETTTAQLASKIAENETLAANLETTTAQLTSKVAENETLTANLETTTAQLTSKVAENQALAANLETTTAQLTSKTVDYEVLVSENGQLEEVKAKVGTLQSQVSSLQSEIASLLGQRSPLIVETYTAGFYCTGSMEPKITCLDSATWLANFRPQDVVVRAVISFTPTAECNLSGSGRPVARRVMDIKMEAGIYYYWPRGDANPQDDGCWIPQTNVNGYIIELHKNTNPENQALREKVNSASAARDTTLQRYEEKEAIYNQKYLEYCGSQTGTCTLPEPQYSEIIQLYNEVQSLYDIYLDAYSAWESAYNEALEKW
ncbi:MAG: hypothetical protein HYX93_02565, partial [Chloroflexi bacterium]|nr:hypothetical protein [Chloroflexota bacterium]